MASARSVAAAGSTGSPTKEDLDDLGSHDGSFEHDRVPPGSNHKEFTYLILSGGRFIYASTARLILLQVTIALLRTATLQSLCGVYASIRTAHAA